MIISLIGFTATGKSTIGGKLADRVDYKFIDLDEYIEMITKMSIKEIFEKKGEKHFRILEKKLLKKLLDQYNDLVISPGGGIIIDQDNIDLIKAKTTPFLLKASPEEIYKRVNNIKDKPMLDEEAPIKSIENLLKKRKRYYSQFKNVIETDNKEISEIVNEIISQLENLKWKILK